MWCRREGSKQARGTTDVQKRAGRQARGQMGSRGRPQAGKESKRKPEGKQGNEYGEQAKATSFTQARGYEFLARENRWGRDEGRHVSSRRRRRVSRKRGAKSLLQGKGRRGKRARGQMRRKRNPQGLQGNKSGAEEGQQTGMVGQVSCRRRAPNEWWGQWTCSGWQASRGGKRYAKEGRQSKGTNVVQKKTGRYAKGQNRCRAEPADERGGTGEAQERGQRINKEGNKCCTKRARGHAR